jgi:hypothetical protein
MENDHTNEKSLKKSLKTTLMQITPFFDLPAIIQNDFFQ